MKKIGMVPVSEILERNLEGLSRREALDWARTNAEVREFLRERLDITAREFIELSEMR